MKNEPSKSQPVGQTTIRRKKKRRKKPEEMVRLSKSLLHQLTRQFAKHSEEFFTEERQRIGDELRSFYVPSTVVIGHVRVSTIKLEDAERIAVRLHDRTMQGKPAKSGREFR